jgi:hypothetical protein
MDSSLRTRCVHRAIDLLLPCTNDFRRPGFRIIGNFLSSLGRTQKNDLAGSPSLGSDVNGAKIRGVFGMVLRPGGRYDSSPAIYRRVRYYTGLRPGGGTSEYRRSCVKAEGPPLQNLVGRIRRPPAHHIDNTGVGRDRLRARRFAAESL